MYFCNIDCVSLHPKICSMMNTKNEKQITVKDSKAQAEVWEWKRKAFEELQSIPPEKRMEHIRHNTQPIIEAILRAKKEKNINPKQD
jgi:hypothetical protein